MDPTGFGPHPTNIPPGVIVAKCPPCECWTSRGDVQMRLGLVKRNKMVARLGEENLGCHFVRDRVMSGTEGILFTILSAQTMLLIVGIC